jgi:Fe-S oxidoreductase
VVVVQDAFTTHYDAQVVLDFIELLQHLGFMPWLAPFRPNGKPQHVLGMLDRFRRTASFNAGMLRELAETGVSLVGVDPSMTLAYRSEYVKALGMDAVPQILLPQELLSMRIDELNPIPLEEGSAWSLLPHCTERTNAPAATSDWIKVSRRLGVDLKILESGCCGMAGLYGHDLANRATSKKIYGLSWGPILASASQGSRTVATGFSCRCQAKIVDGVRLMHPIQLLLRSAKAKRSGSTPRSHTREPQNLEHHEEY